MLNKFKGKTKIILSLALMTCLLLSVMCACSAKRSSKNTLQADIVASPQDISLSSAKKPKGEPVASSGMTSLYLDEDTASPVIKTGTAYWYALPRKTDKASGETPAVFTAEVLCNGRRFILNSQTDCVKVQPPLKTNTENGVCIEYMLLLNDEDKTVQIRVPVTFFLEDGSFYVSVDCANITSSDDDYQVTKLSLMDFFGSDTAGAEGDYILVPDNCGAIIDTYKAKSDFGGASFKVYGDSDGNNALVGVFGMKKENSAFVAVIEKGEAVATVDAYVAANSGYNRVGAQFQLRETMTKPFGEGEVIYVSGCKYTDEIRLCYRFVEGNSANYSGMAIACREHLIRTGLLSSATVENSENLPFVLSTIGEVTNAEGKNVSLTNYEQLLDMLTYLKGKGFSDIYVKYKGALSGGVSQKIITKCEMPKLLGTREQYKELTDYINAQQIKLFFDMGITSFAAQGVSSSAMAKDISGEHYSAEKTDILGTVYKSAYASYDRIDDNVIGVFKLCEKNGITNISINDAAAFLYSDMSSGALRTDVAQMIKEEIISLSTIGDVMAEKGNFYMVNNVSVVTSLPLNTSIQENSYYKGVPFVPLLLHATTQYSSEAINLSADPVESMLRCVEYGALPQFEWCYEEVGNADNTVDESIAAEASLDVENEVTADLSAYSYSDWATPAYTFYEKANRALGNIADLRMTSHYQVKKGVYCTQYGETSIYVNYNEKDVTVGGVTVPARDFMRVN